MSRCVRCGKERIVISSHKEVVSNNEIVYTETSCPDPECQKLVEKSLVTEQKKRAEFKDEHERRILQRQSFNKRKTVLQNA